MASRSRNNSAGRPRTDLPPLNLSDYFVYYSDSGHLVWDGPLCCPRVRGHQVGCEDAHGYLITSLEGRTYKVHRLIWFILHGKWPIYEIDHINRNRLDNSKNNLRECTSRQNKGNQFQENRNKSGVKGVHWCETRKRWVAMIKKNRKNFNLGRFHSKKEAEAAYKAAASQYFGEFAA